MRKMKLMTALGLSIILAAGSTAAVLAEEGRDTSDAEVTLTADEDPDPIDPIDPFDPDDEDGHDPDDEDENKDNSGQLRFDYISNLDFGEIEIIANEDQMEYAAVRTFNNGAKERAPYVQISDLRGTAAGWTLTVTNTQFEGLTEDAANYGNKLAGTRIYLRDIGTTTLVKDEEGNLAGLGTTGTDITLEGNEDAHLVLGAAEGEGAGTHYAYFGDNSTLDDGKAASVELEIPASANKLAGKYKSTLTWVLSDTPYDNE